MKMVPCVCVWDEADVLLIIFLHDGHNNAKDSCHRAPWLIRRGALLIAPHVRGSNNKLSCCAPVLSFDLWTSSKYCIMYCAQHCNGCTVHWRLKAHKNREHEIYLLLVPTKWRLCLHKILLDKPEIKWLTQIKIHKSYVCTSFSSKCTSDDQPGYNMYRSRGCYDWFLVVLMCWLLSCSIDTSVLQRASSRPVPGVCCSPLDPASSPRS